MRCWSSANVGGLFYSCDDKVPVSKVHVPFRIIQSFVFCSAVSTYVQWAYAKYGRLFSSSSLIISLLLRCWSSLKVRGFSFFLTRMEFQFRNCTCPLKSSNHFCFAMLFVRTLSGRMQLWTSSVNRVCFVLVSDHLALSPFPLWKLQYFLLAKPRFSGLFDGYFNCRPELFPYQ